MYIMIFTIYTLTISEGNKNIMEDDMHNIIIIWYSVCIFPTVTAAWLLFLDLVHNAML